MTARLQRRGGDGDGGGGRDEAEGGDEWRVEGGVGGEVEFEQADEGSGRRSAERGRPAAKVRLSAEWRAAVSSRRGADSQRGAAPDVCDCDCAALLMLVHCMLVLLRLFARA